MAWILMGIAFVVWIGVMIFEAMEAQKREDEQEKRQAGLYVLRPRLYTQPKSQAYRVLPAVLDGEFTEEEMRRMRLLRRVYWKRGHDDGAAREQQQQQAKGESNAQ